MKTRMLPIALICLLLTACTTGAPTSISSTPTLGAPTTSSTVTTEPPTDATTEPTEEEPTTEPTPEATAEEPTTEPITEEPTQSPPNVEPTSSTRATPIPISGGALTVVAMGDSMTEGQGDDPWDRGGYPTRLQILLNAERPGSKVINLGVSGWDSTQMIEGQLQQALQANPQIVLVWIGSNNLWYNNGPDNEPNEITTFTNDIDTTLKTLTQRGIRVFIAILDDQTLRPYATSPDGHALSPEGVQHMRRLTDIYNEIIRSKAAQYGATTIDFYNNPLFADPPTLHEDGIHPNARGFDMIAQLWFDVIKAEFR